MNYKIIDLEQGSEEWISFRKDKIGASDAPIIMCESPYKSIYDLWKEKLTGEQKRKTQAMQRGIDLEPVAREKLEKLLGKELKPAVLQHATMNWMIASLDGLSYCGSIAVEIKCPGKDDHELALQGKVPPKYYGQLQHIMYVAYLETMVYCSFDGIDIVTIEVKKDDSYIDRLLDKEKEFFNCIQYRIAPNCRETEMLDMDDNDEWEDALTAYREASAKRHWWEIEEKKAKDTLLALAGGLEAKGKGLKIQKIIKKGNIDYELLMDKYGITKHEADQYRKPNIEFWSFKDE